VIVGLLTEVEGFEVAEAIVNYPNWPEGCDAILVGDTGQEWLLTSDWEEFTSE